MNADSRMMLLVLCGMAVVYWALGTGEVWLLRRRLSNLHCGLALTFLAIFCVMLMEPARGYGTEESVRRYGTEESVRGYGTKEPVRRHGKKKPVRGYGTEEPEWQGALYRRWAAPAYSQDEHARVEVLRQQVIAPALASHLQTHGRYPETLEAAGISTPVTAYGPLRYYASGSEWWLISFGDPKLNGFQADWHSRTQKWGVYEFDI